MTHDDYDHLRDDADRARNRTGDPDDTAPDAALMDAIEADRAAIFDQLDALGIGFGDPATLADSDLIGAAAIAWQGWDDAERHSQARVGGDMTRHRLATWAMFSYPSPMDVLDYRANRWAVGR